VSTSHGHAARSRYAPAMPNLLIPEAPLWALVLRGVVVYLFLVAALRLSGWSRMGR